MKKSILSLLSLLVAVGSAEAKSWKVGPSSVSGMDFASINAAMASSEVVKGDTLYLDQYYNENEEQTVNKQVVIIGTGYDTSLTDEQVVATLTNALHLKANNVMVKSVKLTVLQFYNDNCTLDRCYVNSIKTNSTTAGMNHIYSSQIVGIVRGYGENNPSKMDIQNCLLYHDNSYSIIQDLTSSVISFNTIIYYANTVDYCLYRVTNSEITNNIILKTYQSNRYSDDFHGDIYSSGSGNSIEHNVLSHTTALQYFPNNKIGFGGSSSELFTQTGNYSDYYKLAENSAALTYATDGGEVGCHGGMFGCPAGGRPQYIPYFSKVTVGSVSNEGKLPVSVTIKIQDK